MIAVAGIACGPDSLDDSAHEEDVLAGVEVCNTCTAQAPPPQQQVQVTPRVVAYPSRLLFYGDLSTNTGLAPQPVRVRNGTASAILVTSAEVIEHDGVATGSGGASFFSVETPPLDEPLTNGEEMELMVSFTRSSEQKEALLVITTTHPTFPVLEVQLSGKFFLW